MFDSTSRLGLAAAACLISSAVAHPPLLDAPWRSYDIGDFPTFAPVTAGLGDVDGDGIIDVVAARRFFSGAGISVLLGRGDGSYAPEVIYSLPFSHDLSDIKLTDLDGDGDLDAVTTVSGNSGLDFRIAVFRNTGAGAFGPPQYFMAGAGPSALVIADFTGDGFADVVTADDGYVAGSNDTVSLLVHNGLSGAAAGYLAPVAFTVGDNSKRVLAGDLDGDGDLDLVVGRGDFVGLGGHGSSVLLNDGTGDFGPPAHYDPTSLAYRHSPAIAIVDLDRDGDLDLLSGGGTNGSPSYGVLAVSLNHGDGAFAAPILYNAAEWTFTPHTIITADLNDDGWDDVLISTPSGRANDGYNVLMNDGTGGLHPAIRYEAGKQTFHLLVCDADRDGDSDVLTIANDSSVLTVHPNLGDGTFAVLTRNAVGVLVRDMVQGDIDLDGDPDLVAGGSDNVMVLRNSGDGTFPPGEHFNTPFNPGDIQLADMNNDGWLDLVLRAYDFAVALNDGKGNFLPAVVTPVGASQSGEIGVFDLDNDGDLDVVATDPGPASAVYLFRNNGNGTSFTYMNTIADDDGLPFGVGGGHFNHDGNVDLLFNNALGMTVYLGNGDFTVGGPLPTSDYGYPFIVADLDDDGELDIAYKRPEPSFGTTEVGTMRGFGDGGFTFPNVTAGPNGLESAFRVTSDVDVADITGDGVLDVVFTNNAPNDVSIFPGAGDGTLLDQDRYGAGYSASDSAIADFDGDGRLDVAVVIGLPPSGLGDAAVVLRNIVSDAGVPGDIDGDGLVSFSDLLALLAAWGPCESACSADVDGDGVVGFQDLLIVLENWN